MAARVSGDATSSARRAARRLRRELGLRQEAGGTRSGEPGGVGRLMVVGRERVGHQDRRPGQQEQLGDGGGTRSGDDEMRLAHPHWRVGEEGGEVGRQAKVGVGGPGTVEVLGPALLRDLEMLAQPGPQQPDGGRDHVAEDARTLAAAHDEEPERLALDRRHVGDRLDAEAGRTGLPETRRLPPTCGTASVSPKLRATTLAKRAIRRLARPKTAFCSCTQHRHAGQRRRPRLPGREA